MESKADRASAFQRLEKASPAWLLSEYAGFQSNYYSPLFFMPSQAVASRDLLDKAVKRYGSANTIQVGHPRSQAYRELTPSWLTETSPDAVSLLFPAGPKAATKEAQYHPTPTQPALRQDPRETRASKGQLKHRWEHAPLGGLMAQPANPAPRRVHQQCSPPPPVVAYQVVSHPQRSNSRSGVRRTPPHPPTACIKTQCMCRALTVIRMLYVTSSGSLNRREGPC